jgi:hypothetical protein
MNLTTKNTKSFVKELNKEWRNYTRMVDNLIDTENTHIQKNVTFIIRKKKVVIFHCVILLPMN